MMLSNTQTFSNLVSTVLFRIRPFPEVGATERVRHRLVMRFARTCVTPLPMLSMSTVALLQVMMLPLGPPAAGVPAVTPAKLTFDAVIVSVAVIRYVLTLN